MREFKFGVIGCGLMGREFASAAARWMHLLDMPAKPIIIGVSDVNESAMEWFTTHHPGIAASTNYQDLLKNPEVEAIYCAVPHNLHEQIYIDCIRAGKHLLAEKPFGIDRQAANNICKVIKEHHKVLVRCSSEFPFFPGAQRIVKLFEEKAFGEIIELRAGFCHSSDLDPNKPINWKRKVATNGEYGCMGDLGLHVLHLPLRFGFRFKNVRALLTNVFPTRQNSAGEQEACDTWDNAILTCDTFGSVPMIFEMKRVSPGDTNHWYIKILGTKNSAEFSTKRPKTLRTMPYEPGGRQAWREEEIGYESLYPTITGQIFEFGFSDAILQMWASFVDELAGNQPRFECASVLEALQCHKLFTAALESKRSKQTVRVG